MMVVAVVVVMLNLLCMPVGPVVVVDEMMVKCLL